MSLRTQDPHYSGWSGKLKTDLQIGQGALVEVEATVDDGETTALIVMYRGVDIADTLNDTAISAIDANIARNWVRLVREANRERAADMAEAA